jgi:hypothetical protein
MKSLLFLILFGSLIHANVFYIGDEKIDKASLFEVSTTYIDENSSKNIEDIKNVSFKS